MWGARTRLWANLSTDLARAAPDRGVDGATFVDRDAILWLPFIDASYGMDAQSADLYLLSLLGLVDRKEWSRRAKRFCHRAYMKSARIDQVVHKFHPQLGLTASFASGSVLKKNLWRDVTDRIAHINKIARRRDDPHGHIPAETELARRVHENGFDLSTMDLRTPICIECDTSNDNLQQIMILAMAQSARHVPTSGDHQRQRFHRHAAFRLHEVDLDKESDMGWNDLEHAKTIVQCGVRLRVFPVLYRVTEGSIEMEDALNAFTVLFPSEPGARVGVECARVSAETVPKLIPALLSAIRACPSVRTITIIPPWTDDGDPCDQFWRWMAYTLSGRGARHRIDSVRLEGAIRPECIALMREVTQATNPLAVLYGGDASSKPGGCIEARHFQLLDPTTHSTQGQASVWTSPRPVEADVITSVGVWWSVLLPGYGQAWVHRDNIVRYTAYEQLQTVHRVTRFEHVHNHNDMNELQWAIEMFGSSLTTLSSKCDKQIEAEWIERILVACPLLRRLVLPSTTTLASGCLHIITQTARKLRSLEATVTPNGDASDLIHFFTTLSDENHAFTIAFKTLQLRIVIKHDDDLAFASSFATMLRENRTLTRVALTIEDCRYTGHQGAAVRSLLSISPESEGEHEVHAPVRLKCRLAFLSVIRQTVGSVMSRMDSAVLAKIFAFAAHRERRDVTFHYVIRW